jgi:hypothetical protein
MATATRDDNEPTRQIDEACDRWEYRARFPGHAAQVRTAFEGLPRQPRRADRPEPARGHSDRNLLFGILALQTDFISRDALVAAMSAWVLVKAKSLGEILLDQNALTEDEYQLLGALVTKHLQRHGGDPGRSLAAVSPVGSVREQLQQITDPDLQASLATVVPACPPDGDPSAPRIEWGTQPASGSRYRILRRHAKGGLGEVFVAEDTELHREVALKEIRPSHAHDTYSRTRFLLEAEITGGLEHPGVIGSAGPSPGAGLAPQRLCAVRY